MNWLGAIVLLICLVPAWEVGSRFGIQGGLAATMNPDRAPSWQRSAAIAGPGMLLLFIPCLIGGFLLEWASLTPFTVGEGWTALALYIMTIAGFVITFSDGLRNNRKRLERTERPGDLDQIGRAAHDELASRGRIASPKSAPRVWGSRSKRTHKRH
jgi:hypothetical protein